MTIQKKVTVSRTATISAPLHKVYKQISNFEKFAKWSPWANLDSTMTLERVIKKLLLYQKMKSRSN